MGYLLKAISENKIPRCSASFRAHWWPEGHPTGIDILVNVLRRDTIKAHPFALSLAKGECKNPTHWKLSPSWFDKLTTNGLTCPALSR